MYLNDGSLQAQTHGSTDENSGIDRWYKDVDGQPEKRAGPLQGNIRGGFIYRFRDSRIAMPVEQVDRRWQIRLFLTPCLSCLKTLFWESCCQQTFVLSKSKKPGIIIREQVVAVSHVESLDFNEKVSQPVVNGAVVRLTGMGIDLRLGIPKSYRAKNG